MMLDYFWYLEIKQCRDDVNVVTPNFKLTGSYFGGFSMDISIEYIPTKNIIDYH